MGFFSRKNAAPDAPSTDVPFESIRRSPRNTRKPRTVVAGDPSSEPAVPLDPARAAKTRARRRLIGAVALALAAVVFVPMLFDRAPVAPQDDIALQIPDKDSPFEGRRGPDQRGPLRPTTPLPPTASDAAPPQASDAPSADAGRMESSVSEQPAERQKPPDVPKPVTKAPERAADRPPVESAAAKPPSVEKPRPPASGDDPRAIAALEGKPEPAPSDAAGKTFAVQVAAFSAAEKARGLRDQLVSNGLRSYTESVSTPQGLRTRVRLGPFPSRDAADKARQKLKTMKLEGSVVGL